MKPQTRLGSGGSCACTKTSLSSGFFRPSPDRSSNMACSRSTARRPVSLTANGYSGRSAHAPCRSPAPNASPAAPRSACWPKGMRWCATRPVGTSCWAEKATNWQQHGCPTCEQKAAVLSEKERVLAAGQARFHMNAMLPATWEHDTLEEAKETAAELEREACAAHLERRAAEMDVDCELATVAFVLRAEAAILRARSS